MALSQIDYFFPFFVFFYGIIILFVFHIPALKMALETQTHPVFSRLKAHENLAWICFFVGGMWSLQNLLTA